MPLRLQPSLPAPAPRQMERILDARTEALAARQRAGAATGPAAIPLLACTLGAETYGLPMAAIARIVPTAPLTPLPGGPPAMLGLLGRAGQVFIVLDLGLALGLPASGQAEGGHLLLLRQPGPRRFALRVDRAAAALRATPLEAAAPEEAPHRAVTGHALSPEGGLIGLVDLPRLLHPFLAPGPARAAEISSESSSDLGSVTP
jgi:purine-binding chemotaxis protein CheW